MSLVNVSASALRLGWSSPDTPNGIITVYNIYVTYDNGSIENMTVNGSENSYLIGGLSPHQLVYVSISASTIAGEGPSTSRLEQRTGQASKTIMRPLFVSVQFNVPCSITIRTYAHTHAHTRMHTHTYTHTCT